MAVCTVPNVNAAIPLKNAKNRKIYAVSKFITIEINLGELPKELFVHNGISMLLGLIV